MTNHLNNLFHSTILFFGLLLLPFFSFSQQEEPKRVSVIITAKEITPQKEVVQIPADNTPKVVSKPTIKTTVKPTQTAEKKNILPAKNTAQKEQPISTAPVTAKKEQPISTAPVTAKKATSPIKVPVSTTKTTTTPAKTKSTETIVRSKPIEVKKEKVNEQATPKQVVAATPNKEVKTPEVKRNNASSSQIATNPKTIAKADVDKTTNEVLEAPTNSKINSFSYIWIGIFLIVAGVVLGLLFGKPAFLISFVGIVFIALGLIIK